MCAVLGACGRFSRREWEVAHRLLIELAIASEVRGTDAAGYAALTSRGELLWARQPGPARRLFCGQGFGDLYHENIILLIGHTRFATNGAPAVNGNNHPHILNNDLSSARPTGDRGSWVVVHNGHISDHEQKAALHGFHLHSQCDSEILVHALARYGEIEGPEACLALGGKQSVLAINARTKHLLAWTNGGMPLVSFSVVGLPGVWWASTEAIARRALDKLGLKASFEEAERNLLYRCQATAKRQRSRSND